MQDVNFLYQIGTMRHIQRVWTKYGGLPMANLAEHTLRVTWIALILALEEKADLERVLLIALIHDLSEIRTGDVDFVSRLYCDKNDDQSILDIATGTSAHELILGAWQEYKERKTLESKIVKDADILDCDLELREQTARGASLEEILTDLRKRAHQKLSTDTAQRLSQQIQASNPHQWWTQTILGNIDHQNSALRKIA